MELEGGQQFQYLTMLTKHCQNSWKASRDLLEIFGVRAGGPEDFNNDLKHFLSNANYRQYRKVTFSITKRL